MWSEKAFAHRRRLHPGHECVLADLPTLYCRWKNDPIPERQIPAKLVLARSLVAPPGQKGPAAIDLRSTSRSSNDRDPQNLRCEPDGAAAPHRPRAVLPTSLDTSSREHRRRKQHSHRSSIFLSDVSVTAGSFGERTRP